MAKSFNHLPAVAKAHSRGLEAMVNKVAFVVQGHAVSGAPVDTGFLRNSIYVVTAKASTYGKVGAATKKGSYLLPQVKRPTSRYEAFVAVAANYGIYVEYGTRYMPAQPYMSPAVYRSRQALLKEARIVDSFIVEVI